MPDRYGQGGDYSQTFAYLWQQWDNNITDQAKAADARRESEQAAKDTEAFARYDAGRMSGAELLAYIRHRISQTAYDPKQQADWKKALLQYTESINDAQAQAAFERTNDYNGYIEYLKSKLAGSKGNAVKAADIQKQINDLTDARDSQDITRGAERIMLKIAKGQASYSDLLKFYKTAIGNSRPGSKTRSDTRQAISDLTAKVHAENVLNQKDSLDNLLASHRIDSVEYGKRLATLARTSGIENTDPTTFHSWISDSQKFQHSIPSDELKAIDDLLSTGAITPSEAESRYYGIAQRYMAVDPVLAGQIRNAGWQVGRTPIPGQTPLPGMAGATGMPTDLGSLGGAVANKLGGAVDYTLKWITQLDGSEFAQVNCVMASTAMLAYAMGYREKGGGIISGGDVRYLTGDREMGTNLDQAEYALGKLGITGLRNFNDRHISFEEFKKRVGGRGMPAVLMGVYANMPPALRANPTLTRGHGMFVAGYDPKANKFLVMDPAVSKNTHPNYKGVWMDASVIKNFGWGPSYSDSTGTYSFSGQALFAPPHTIKGQLTVGNYTGASSNIKVHYVSVDDAPVRRQTPRQNYTGLHATGRSGVQPIVGNAAVDRNNRPRAATGKKAVNENDPATVEQALGDLEQMQETFSNLNDISNAFRNGNDSWNGMALTPDVIKGLDQQVLDMYDGAQHIFGLLKDPTTQDWGEGVDKGHADSLYSKLHTLRESFTNDVAARLQMHANDAVNTANDIATKALPGIRKQNSITADYLINRTIDGAKDELATALANPDRNAGLAAIARIRQRLQGLSDSIVKTQTDNTQLNDLQSSQAGDNVDVGTPGSIQRLDAIMKAFDAADSDQVDPVRVQQALDALGESHTTRNKDGQIDKAGTPLGNLIYDIASRRDAENQVANGTAAWVINGQNGNWTIRPLISKVGPDGVAVQTIDYGKDADGNPIQPIMVPEQTASGTEWIPAIPGYEESAPGLSVKKGGIKDANGNVIIPEGPVGSDNLQKLNDLGIQQAIKSGQVEVIPTLIPFVQTPGRVGANGVVKGTKFYVDQDGKGGRNFAEGGLPIKDMGIIGGYTPVGPDGMPQWNYQPYASYAESPYPFMGDRNWFQRELDGGTMPPPTDNFSRGADGKAGQDPNLHPRFATWVDASGYGRGKVSGGTRTDKVVSDIQNALDNALSLARAGLIDRQEAMSMTPDQLVEQSHQPWTGVQRALPDPQADSLYWDAEHPNPAVKDRQSQAFGPQTDVNDLTMFGQRGQPAEMPDARTITAPLTDLAKQFGVNIIKQGPDGKAQGPAYTPPAPKQTKVKAETTALPKIGNTSVMVGGTRIDVPSSKPAKTQTFKIPDPKTVGNISTTPIGKTETKGPTNETKGGTPQSHGNY